MNWADYLDWGAREDANKPLVYCNGVMTTYGEMRLWANRIGNVLTSLGVTKGDRVATYLPTTSLHEAMLLGSLKLGAIGCPLSMREKPSVVLSLLQSLEAKVLVVDGEQLEFAREAQDHLPVLEIVVANGTASGFRSLDDLVGAASPDFVTVPMRDDDIAFVAFTAGSTGRPKGVQVTARMLRAHNYTVADKFQMRRASEVFFGFVNYWHVGGLVTNMAPAYTTGGTHILIQKWDPDEALCLIEKYKVTSMFGPATMYRQLVRSPLFASIDWTCLKCSCSGGEVLSPDLKKRWDEVTNSWLGEGFGMSEASVQVLLPGPGELGCGKVFSRIEELRLVDTETGLTIEGTGEGELLVRGDNVMPGYWRDPEGTKKKIDEEGWYWTGDMLRRDEEGNYYTVGRVDDMFKAGGEKIFPVEVETALEEHADVTKAFCFPEPHPEWGQVPCAVVELRPGAETDAEKLLEFAASHPKLPRFKRPRRIFCIDALPMGATGKVVRRDVMAWLATQGYKADIK